MMLTVDIKCRLFLQREYFVSVLFTDINKCSWHGITIPYQINIAYSHPTQTIVSFNQTVDCLRKSPLVGDLRRQPSVWLNKSYN